ncbi:MAG: helix-turn-helix transcriptional regulator, partial [Thermoanaerobaculia bacterium]
MKESVGYLLKRTREVREIELEEVSKKTKISVRFLQAIEEGRWSILPGDVFVKGFIRAYAQYLGLNPEEVVEKYVQERMPKERAVEDTIKKKPRGKNFIWVGVLIFFLFAFLLIYLSLP